MTEKNKTGVQEIIEKSGNSFHSRVIKLLRDEKWTVLVSPYYSDNFTDKPREIDIVAARAFDVHAFMSDWLGTLNIRLFIECKYINSNTVFWFDAKDKEKSIERIMIDTGLDHPYKNISIEQHHYFVGVHVAKLFASEKSRSEDNEIISRAINQNLNAMVYHRNRTDLVPQDGDKRVNVLRNVSYPIIVVNSFDNFYRTNMEDGSEDAKPITEPFQLEVNYAYVDKDRKEHNEYFLIDVVSFDKLPEFLSSLEKKDVKIISYDLGQKESEMRRNQRDNSGGMYSTTYS